LSHDAPLLLKPCLLLPEAALLAREVAALLVLQPRGVMPESGIEKPRAGFVR
jgi:hypothetical protein